MLDMDLRYDTAYDTADQGHELLRSFMTLPPAIPSSSVANNNKGSTGDSGNLDMQRAQAALDAACQSLGIDTTTNTPTTVKKTATTKPSSSGSIATAAAAALNSPVSPKPIKRPPTTPYIHLSLIHI